MEELFNAAKNLLSHRESYFKNHPEILESVLGIEDKEYDEAWQRLDNAVKNNEPDTTDATGN